MKILLSIALLFFSPLIFAQEGRPALASETSEDERVKSTIKKAFPHDLENWEVEDESKTDGITWFHNGGEAANSPFTHQYKINYKRKNVSEQEREKWKKVAVDVVGIQKMMAETECEIVVTVNTFFTEFEAENLQTKAVSPFNLSMVGPFEAKYFMGNGWKISKNESLEDNRRNYVVEAAINKGVPMTQIQTIHLDCTGSPTVVDFILKNTDLKAIQTLVGQNKITQPTNNQTITKEKPLTKPLEGNNEIEFTLDGGDFHNRTFKLKHSKDGEFGYLLNNHPNPAITDNAMTRILIQEDDDFKTKNKTGFLDITIPFIRKTGEFEVFKGAEKASFAGGINCWDGCEYSFDADGMKVNVSRYDAVGGFIEGTFEGEVTVGYKINQPLDNDQKKRPNAQIKGRFKVHRKEDRY
ncbi:hypothetical protein GCM10011514_00250 [Emticicia aquatilis]|uniref:Uncharacterized protein n=1 Tax=Emticicia aquatilis TaxID=1537369 RepID=A0A916YD98_9BACT|nr:hypothetical protein [Emticicia aquatilis]GGD40117.1 hypothetical protein GCM10011514_00250 [Emticicia aquatilis]